MGKRKKKIDRERKYNSRVRARVLAISNSLSRLDPPTWSSASEPERAMIDAGASGHAGREKGSGTEEPGADGRRGRERRRKRSKW